MPNIPIKLQRWIGIHRKILLSQHAKTTKKQIREKFDICLTTQQLHFLLKPERIVECENAKFISLAVGYQTCSKQCECYKKRVSESVKKSKSSLTVDQKNVIANKRKATLNKKYGVDNVFQLESVKDKAKESLIEKYGVDNPMKSQEVREQAKQTCRRRYGVENPMLDNRIKDSNHSGRDYLQASRRGLETKKKRYGTETYNNRTQASETCQKTYGVDNPAKDSTVRKKISTHLRKSFISRHLERYQIALDENYQPSQYNQVLCVTCQNHYEARISNGHCTKCPHCYPDKHSNFENEVYEFVSSITQSSITRNDRNILDGKEIDILVCDHRLGIECNGLYWHVEETGKDRNYHRNKTMSANEAGVKLIHLYSDVWKNKAEIVKSRISHLLGKTSNVVYARNCSVELIDLPEARQFLDHNHIDGYHRSSIRFALVFRGEIVSVMTFAKARYQSNCWEMIRFASHRHRHVVGAASRLFKQFIKHTNSSKVVTYSDNDWGITDFYRQLGFRRESFGQASYFYIDRGQFVERINREHLQKHKLVEMGFDKKKTESEIARDLGLSRVWTSGSSRWIWERKNK